MFPADAGAISELEGAVAAALREQSIVPIAERDARRELTRSIFEGEPDDIEQRLGEARRPFAFRELRAFLASPLDHAFLRVDYRSSAHDEAD